MARGALRAVRHLGFDVERAANTVKNTPRFVRDIVQYHSATSSDDRFALAWSRLMPILTEYGDQAGNAGGHYFFQDIWAAKKIHRARPARHVDVGSRIDGFVAHLLVFMEVEEVDIRPLDRQIENLKFIRDDATTLASIPANSVESLSSLHAVEHFGLGRYGDPITPNGWELGMASLSRVLAPGGTLYFSVPVGVERVHFNAHRIFSPRTVLQAFSELRLASFAAVKDDGMFVDPASPSEFEEARNACGLFEFVKPAV